MLQGLEVPTPFELDLLHIEEDAAVEVNQLAHKGYIASLRGEIEGSCYNALSSRINELFRTRRLDPRPQIPLRHDADRKGGLRVLRKIKHELMTSGWRRLKGGRFQKDFGAYWIQLWFDPGTYVDNLSAYLAVGPPRISVDLEKFFDISLHEYLFFGPPEEFEKNLRALLVLVDCLAQGLKELLDS
jgi:hypothetical protein